MKNRDLNIDALKGILIILVVIGHVLASLNLEFVNYIYLFHMPAFIILSGMCYRNFNFKKEIFKTFIPFFAYMVLIYFYSKYFLYDTPFRRLFMGGELLRSI